MDDSYKDVAMRYQTDISFRMLVDQMQSLIHTGKVSLQELKEAATYACVRYELWHSKPMLIPFDKEPT